MKNNNLIYRLSNHSTVFLFVLLAFTFVVKFPFLLKDVINWDESTHILVGYYHMIGIPSKDIFVHGHPLMYKTYELIQYFFGKSLLAIRLFGVIFTTIAYFYVYKIGKFLGYKDFGRYSALGGVFISEVLIKSNPALMSEHVAILFAVPAVYYYLRKSPHWFILSGFLVGMAVTNRANLVYLAVGLFIYIIFEPKELWKKRISNSIWFALGGALAVCLTFFVFYIDDYFEVFWNEGITLARRYSMNQNSPIDVLGRMGKKTFIIILCYVFSVLVLILKKKLTKNIFVLFMCSFLVLLSILLGGVIYSHYLIQFIPFFIFPAGLASSILLLSLSPYLHKRQNLIFILVLTISTITYLIINRSPMMKTYSAFQTDRKIWGKTLEIEKIIRNKNSNPSLFCLSYNLLYWHFDKMPPVKEGTHPTNLLKDFLYESPEQQNEILETIFLQKKPEFIIMHSNTYTQKRPSKQSFDAINYAFEQIKDKYVRIAVIEGVDIYQIIPNER